MKASIFNRRGEQLNGPKGQGETEMKRLMIAVLGVGVTLAFTVAAQASVTIDLTNDPSIGPMSNVQSSIGGQNIVVPVTGTVTNGGLSTSYGHSNTTFSYDIHGNSATFVTTFDQYRLGGASQTDGQAYITFSVDTPSLFSLQSDYIPSDPNVIWVHSDMINDANTYDIVFDSWNLQNEWELATISATGVLPVGTYTVVLWDAIAGSANGLVTASGTATLTVEASPVPEPGTMIIWSLLGAGSWLGMRVWRRRGPGLGEDAASRVSAQRTWSPEARQAIHEIIARGSRTQD
jgi:hypothetical protein